MKVDVECYYVKADHSTWGYFTVLMRGLSAFTDYGCFGFTFYPGEQTAKEFLAHLTDNDYLLRKIAHRNVLDVDATERAVRKDILHQRRDGYISKDRARELWNDLPADKDIMEWVMEQREFSENDGYELAVYDFPPEAKLFAERLFPLFREELRREVAWSVA